MEKEEKPRGKFGILKQINTTRHIRNAKKLPKLEAFFIGKDHLLFYNF